MGEAAGILVLEELEHALQEVQKFIAKLQAAEQPPMHIILLRHILKGWEQKM